MINLTEKVIEARVSATTDMFGKEIKIGSKVRSFDHPLISSEGVILGMETECTEKNRVQYIEGVVEAIGEVKIEGCARYSIRVTKEVCYAYGKDYAGQIEPGHRIFPPLNGTPTMFSSICFGVVAL